MQAKIKYLLPFYVHIWQTDKRTFSHEEDAFYRRANWRRGGRSVLLEMLHSLRCERMQLTVGRNRWAVSRSFFRIIRQKRFDEWQSVVAPEDFTMDQKAWNPECAVIQSACKGSFMPGIEFRCIERCDNP